MKARTKKEVVQIGLLVDESGSMYSLSGDTIGTVNGFIKDQKKVKGEAEITIASFNDNYKLIKDREDIKNIEEITSEDYSPSGMTALYDSIMKIISSIEETKAKKAIIAIITDGMENSSIEYKDSSVIKEKIQQKQKDGWQILFLAANIDEKAVGASFGINAMYTQAFTPTADGVIGAMSYTSRCVSDYRGNND
ncbi:MAG: hypothetical protein M0P71_01655 [Melioribacteraceae bacterium]|nr:hypothetical protein [Melioribacteraceae bacterium]